MKSFLIGALTALAIGIALAAAVVLSGRLDMAADTRHHPVVHDLIELSRERSIAHASRGIAPPADLGDGERLRRAAGNYDAMCVGCHLAPGQRDSELRAGLYPVPPNFARPAAPPTTGEQAAARRFWIIKHGIRASGMPAWSKGGMEDAAIWDLVALVPRLAELSPEQYRHLVATSEGHTHRGMAGAANPRAAPAKPHVDTPGQPHVH